MTRKEAIKVIKANYPCGRYLGLSEALDIAIEVLNQEPMTGHWIETPNAFECSECQIIRAKGTTGKYNYCPSCGAKMAESEDKE